MPFNELSIKLLSKSNEVIKSATCIAGQVSVFRSTSEFELKNFGMALLGMPGSNKFQISLDGKDFVAGDHLFVGFGERRAAGELTVRQYLMKGGVQESQILDLVGGAGITEQVDQRLDALSVADIRAVRLLVIAFGRMDGVVVLNDPFRPLSVDQREFFAKSICDYAQLRKAIVIVTDLSSRPDCWINNPLIIRIDLSKRQPTIGFGSQDLDMQTLVKQVQEAVRNSPSEAIAQPTFNRQRQRTYIWAGMMLLIVLIMGFNWIVLKRQIATRAPHSDQGPVQIVDASKIVTPAAVPVAVPHTQSQQLAHMDAPPTLAVPQVAEATEDKARFALASYSSAIQKSVHDAFVGVGENANTGAEQSALLLSGGDVDSGRRRVQNSQPSELLKMLEAASAKDEQNNQASAGSAAPDGNMVQNFEAPQVEDWERQREAMRQRFLQSIVESGQAQ